MREEEKTMGEESKQYDFEAEDVANEAAEEVKTSPRKLSEVFKEIEDLGFEVESFVMENGRKKMTLVDAEKK